MKFISTKKILTTALMLALATGIANAQQKKAAPKKEESKGPEIITGTGPQPEWVKACGKDASTGNKQNCIITRDLRSESGQTLVSLGIREIEGTNKKLLLVSVPPGVLLVPGMRVNVDDQKPMAAKFTICFPNNCFAEAEASDATVAMFKKGENIISRVFNQQGQEIGFSIKLDGFAKAYDGDPIDPKVVEEEQKKLQSELQKRAEEARKKLMDQSTQPQDKPKQ